jgi:cell division inhibitor SepF
MGALRRAGVWLGLIEDEYDRDSFYDDEDVDDEDVTARPRGRSLPRPTQRRAEPEERVPYDRDLRVVRDRDRVARDSRLHDEYDEPLERPMPRQPSLRLAEPVRPAARPVAGSTALSVPSQENLTLAPPVHLRERAAVSDDRLTRRHEITTLHPASYSDARAIGEQFRDGHPVLMNLTDLAESDAKRLVDFAAGLAFGLRGGIEPVTNRVFLLTPPNIRVSDEDRQRIAEPGFFDR